MTFKIYNENYNLQDLARKIGYRPLGFTEKQEFNCVRPLGADYPRFHIYMSTEPEIVTINLHLDQKKPSYEGTTAHSGDYDSKTIQEEIQRIKDMLFK